jgi:hypothetical protein
MLFFQTSSSTSDTQRRPRGACSWGFGARIASTAHWEDVLRAKELGRGDSRFKKASGSEKGGAKLRGPAKTRSDPHIRTSAASETDDSLHPTYWCRAARASAQNGAPHAVRALRAKQPNTAHTSRHRRARPRDSEQSFGIVYSVRAQRETASCAGKTTPA